MAEKRSRPRRRRRSPTDELAASHDPPRLGPDAQRAEPLEGESPAIQRNYDPGFTSPAEDDDPWQDEGHPEASG